MLRENSPILGEETISTILSEDASTISIVMNAFPEDSRVLIEVEAVKMIREALDDGHIDPPMSAELSWVSGFQVVRKEFNDDLRKLWLFYNPAYLGWNSLRIILSLSHFFPYNFRVYFCKQLL